MVSKKKENKFLFYLLSFTWGLLWTLIGFLVLGFVSIFFRKEIEIHFIGGRIFVEFLERNFGGASLGIVILVDKMSDRLMNHEVGHTIQAQWMGPFFIFLVAIPSGIRYQLWDWLVKRHKAKTGEWLDYDSVWFEGQATRLGETTLWNL